MDADSSYGGSDTAQDTTMSSTPSPTSHNQFYHKNEITLPVNLDEVDFQNSKLELKPPSPKLPHYTSTANLNVNEDEVGKNLEPMKKAFSSTSKLNEKETPKSRRKSASGVDNPAFEDEKKEPEKELNSSVSLGLKSPTKESNEQMTEAVNLELVNLKPHLHENGVAETTIPVKKQTELDMGEGYDEYFVPVNEHRKIMSRGRGSVTFADSVCMFGAGSGNSGVGGDGLSLTPPARGVLDYPNWMAMDQDRDRDRTRGEKLVVTMDKRSKKGCGKCFCWGICLAILIAAIIIGILAATGVILGKEAQPVSENSVSSRQFGGGFKKAGLFGSGDQDETTTELTPSSVTPSAPISTVSSLLPTTDTSRIQVPRALEGQLIIDNKEFTPGLGIQHSPEFNELAQQFEKQIKDALFDAYTQNYGYADINVRVIDFTPGSVIVHYRVTWQFKPGVHGVQDPINEQKMLSKIDKHLTNNQEYIGNFHVPKSTATSKRVLDMCQIEKNGCEYDCIFDYNLSDFRCTCPDDQELTEDSKTCRFTMNDHSHHGHDHSYHDHHHNHDDITTMNIHHLVEPEEPSSEPEPSAEPEPTASTEPSTSAEPEPTAEPGSSVSIKPEPTAEPEPIAGTEPTAEPEPEPSAEPTAKPETVTKPEPEPSAEPAPFTEIETKTTEKSESLAKLTLEPHPSSEPEPSAEPEPEPSAEPTPTTEPTIKEQSTTMKVHYHHIVAVEHETTAEPQPSAEPEPTAEPSAIPEPSAEPTAEPKPSTEPKAEPEPSTEETKSLESESKLVIGPEQSAEPEPSTEEIKSLESESKQIIDPEPSAEPTAEPEPSSEESATVPNTKSELKTLPETTTEVKTSSKTNIESEISIVNKSENSEITTMTSTTSTTTEMSAQTEPIVKSEGRSLESIVSINSAMNTSIDNETSTEMPTTTSYIHVHNIPVVAESATEITTVKESIEQTTKQESNVTTILPNVQAENTTTVVPMQQNATTETPATTEMNTEKTDNLSTHAVKYLSSKNEVNETSNTVTEVKTEQTNAVLTENDLKTHLPHYIHELHPETSTEMKEATTQFSSTSEASSTVHTYAVYEPNAEEEPLQVNETQHSTPKAKNIIFEESNSETNEDNEENESLSVVPLVKRPIEETTTVESTTMLSSTTDNTNNERTTTKTAETTVSVSFNDITKSDDDDIKLEQSTRLEQLLPITTQEIVTEYQTDKSETTTVNTDIQMSKIFSTIHEIIDENEKTTTGEMLTEVPTTQMPTLENDQKNETNPIEENKNIHIVPVQIVTENFNENTTDNMITTSESAKYVIMNNTAETTTNDINIEKITPTTEEISTVSTVHAEIEQTVTETIKIVPEHEDYTDYNDLLTSSTERTENIVHITTTQNYTLIQNSTELGSSSTTEFNSETNESFDDDENSALSVIPLKPRNKYKKVEENTEKFDTPFTNDIEGSNESVLTKYNYQQTTLHYANDVSTSASVDSTTASIIASQENLTTNNVFEKSTEGIAKAEEFRTFSKCASGQFQCVNGTTVKDGSYCIAKSARCDSIDDCSDRSDEIGCEEENCLDNFKCNNGQCLRRHLVCDGIVQCIDGSDESGCDAWRCRFDEVSCGGPGSRCVPLTWRCDGLAHCPDGSDERDCLAGAHCPNRHFRCVEQDTCIPDTWRCDGEPDCLGAEDERLCECALDQLKCASGGCVPQAQRCDGVDHCPDRSDEWDCVKIDANATISKMFLHVQGTDNRWHYVCSEGWNDTHSDLACQTLGYVSSAYTEHTYSQTVQADTDFFRLKSNLTYSQTPKLLTMLEKADTCSNVVSIACHEFTCGNHNPTDPHITARITGGATAARNQWPSVTLLYNKRRNTHCTASLLAPTWALASHACVAASTAAPDDWMFYAGGIYFDKSHTNVSDVQMKKIKTILTHPQAKYSQFVYRNDVTLLELSSPVTLGRNVSAICLPQHDLEPRPICVTAGWGVTEQKDSNLHQYLHYLPVPTVDKEECNSTKHYNGQLTEDQICAGYTDSEKTPCYNDEGAPLMCYSDSTGVWEVQGLLSAHGNCGRNRHPALYTALGPAAREWIAHTVGSRALQHNPNNHMFNV